VNGTTRAPWTAWLAALLGLVVGGWMLFDGLRRLFIGDFVRIDGQLGPWTQIVAAFGIDPMSMGLPFVLLGALWILGCLGLVAARPWGWKLTLAMAMVSLFYLLFGTLIAFVVLNLLLMRRTREVYVVLRSVEEPIQVENSTEGGR
jgi:hypothetical protein